MKVKTSELTGLALDWAVAKCEEKGLPGGYRTGMVERGNFTPSTNWAQGGPLIEREKISVELKPHGYWMASYQYNYADEKRFLTLGDTPLIAAMRCFCASHIGDEVEIPDELTN